MNRQKLGQLNDCSFFVSKFYFLRIIWITRFFELKIKEKNDEAKG